MMADRETALFLAELALKMRDNDEVIKNMKLVAEMGVELSAFERKMFRLAYCLHIRKRRDSWDTVARLLLKEESEGNENGAALTNRYKLKIETEISNICSEVLSIIEECLIPSSNTHAGLVFYHTMRGDYYRYWGEISVGADWQGTVDLALQAYNFAWETAQANLALAHPNRLGSALNLALFHLEIVRDIQSAFNVVQQALDGDVVPGIRNLSDVDEQMDSYHLVSRLIRKMITLLQIG